jgi:L-alanine-DL-glutamate epimerase-like enolase superfamily enzyme
MRIESVDLYYLAMPQVLDIGDGSQDTLLVRVQAGGYEGWGECEASPLTSLASWVCPMSHSACKPVRDSVLGQRLDDVDDIARINAEVRANSLDLLQADHTLSGIDIALWDLLGHRLSEPVYRLLGFTEAYPKLPYASVLFGDEPQGTLVKAREARAAGYRAAKFGWGPYGRGSVQDDTDQVAAAREGLGPEGALLVDAGTVWLDDVAKAAERLPALRQGGATWLEEPFVSGATAAYAKLAALAGPVKLAGGEGSHTPYMAMHMIDHAEIGYVQIDAGRVGGITSAREVAAYADARDVQYVNHTFTSQLALSASLQPYAGYQAWELCEFPVESSAMARAITPRGLVRDQEGMVHLPDAPGLGLEVDTRAIWPYRVDVEIRVGGKTLYSTPGF